MTNLKIGIIGGTGMKNVDLFHVDATKNVETPYGPPSSALICGKLDGVSCVLLNRHGDNHDLIPSNINYRANVYALKQEACTHIIATTACGSLKEEIEPGHFVLVDQFIDRTTKRETTFYNGDRSELQGVCHIAMRAPFCEKLINILMESCCECSIQCHAKGTTVTIEGPRFSTYAESNMFRSWGASVVNMTTVPEVVLANELGVMYAAVAMVTDYDCWRDDHDSVNVENVMKMMEKNREKVLEVVASAVKTMSKINWEDDIRSAELAAKTSVML